jgi:hypothetical protein
MKPTSQKVSAVICLLMALFIFISSFFPAFFKTISIASVTLEELKLQQFPIIDVTKINIIERWVRISLFIVSGFVLVLIPLVFLLNRKEVHHGFKFCGVTMFFTGLASVLLGIILFVFWNSSSKLQSIVSFFKFSSMVLDGREQVFLQIGNIFLFYLGLTGFGILTLGLTLILLARLLNK